MKAGGKLPAANLGEAGADVVRQWAVDGDAGHAVSWVAEALKPWRGFPFPLEWGWVACLHVYADHVIHVVGGGPGRPRGRPLGWGIPKASVTMLHTPALHHVEEVDGRGHPDVLFTGDHARGVVLTEDPWGQGFGIL